MKTDRRMIIVPDFMIFMKAIEDNPGSTVSDLYEITKITYTHVYSIKAALTKKEWISFEKDGNKRPISLTPQGQRIVDGINYLLQEMGITQEDIAEYRKKSKIKKKKEEVKKDGDAGIQHGGIQPGEILQGSSGVEETT